MEERKTWEFPRRSTVRGRLIAARRKVREYATKVPNPCDAACRKGGMARTPESGLNWLLHAKRSSSLPEGAAVPLCHLQLLPPIALAGASRVRIASSSSSLRR